MDTILACQNISKKFFSGSEDIHVLHDVSLFVNAAESVSIRGESGSGKTTLLNILAGLESSDQGEVFWSGKAIRKKSLHRLSADRKRYLGMVFQSFYLIPELNALENVLFAARILGRVGSVERKRAQDLLVRVGLGERLKSNPLKLSGGERQRVAVARALMNRPQVVLADEPTGNLDEATGKHIMDMLLAITREENAGLILVTHNMEFASKTDRCCHLIKGCMES